MRQWETTMFVQRECLMLVDDAATVRKSACRYILIRVSSDRAQDARLKLRDAALLPTCFKRLFFLKSSIDSLRRQEVYQSDFSRLISETMRSRRKKLRWDNETFEFRALFLVTLTVNRGASSVFICAEWQACRGGSRAGFGGRDARV